MPSRSVGEALIRVLLTGICNTDLELVKGYMGFQGILGHEFVGIVEECDETKWLGKRVVGEINCGCGECRYCQNGLQNHCPNRTVLGIAHRNGACADFLTLPFKNLHTVPDAISDEEAVFVEPLAAAFRVVDQVPLTSSQRVIVVGDGKLGLLVAQVIQTTQCDLRVIGRHPKKLELLQERGVKTTLAGEYGGDKADVVVDCTGSFEGFESALRLTQPEGTLVLKSTLSDRLHFDIAPVVVNEITIIGSRCGPFQPAIDALSERVVSVRSLISSIMPIERGTEAFNLASQRETVKVLLRVSS